MGKAEVPGLTDYAATVHRLSERLVEAQRPMRILDAIQWDESIERTFFAAQARSLPPVTRDYYLSRPLRFDPDQKDHEFRLIERDVRRQLGELDVAGRLLTRRCAEYREVVRMLRQRGSHSFAQISAQLYGSSRDRFHAGAPKLADLASVLDRILDDDTDEVVSVRTVGSGARSQAAVPGELDARAALTILTARLSVFFGDRASVRVKLSDGIVADAAAGSDYIKLRREARFHPRDLGVLEVHEGWVHLGTTLNGQGQPVCTFLGKGPPSSTVTQEGLAVLMELLAGVSHSRRMHRLAGRIAGVALAEAGANFLDVYRYYLDAGQEPRESYQQTMRIFRGSLPEGCGPFTKDLSYGRGLILLYNFIRQALDQGQFHLVPLLFCGKTSLDEIPLLDELLGEGLLSAPRFLPRPFDDRAALAAWIDSRHLLPLLLRDARKKGVERRHDPVVTTRARTMIRLATTAHSVHG